MKFSTVLETPVETELPINFVAIDKTVLQILVAWSFASVRIHCHIETANVMNDYDASSCAVTQFCAADVERIKKRRNFISSTATVENRRKKNQIKRKKNKNYELLARCFLIGYDRTYFDIIYS